jgi:hypothetical protein
METSMEIPQKKKKNTNKTRNTTIILSIYSKKCNSGYNKDNCIPMFIVTLFTTAKVWVHSRFPTTYEWIIFQP